MELTLVLAPGAAAVGDQFVIARVEAEGVFSRPEPDIAAWSSGTHAAILRRCDPAVHAAAGDAGYCIKTLELYEGP
jgi:hypothetical protein